MEGYSTGEGEVGEDIAQKPKAKKNKKSHPAAVEYVLDSGVYVPSCSEQCADVLVCVGESHVLELLE